MEIVAINAAVAALRSAYDGVKTLMTMETRGKLLDELTKVRQSIDTAQQRLFELRNTVAAQEEEMREAKAKLREIVKVRGDAANYVLTNLGPDAWAYAIKPAGDGGDPSPYFCVHCLDRGEKSILQHKGGVSGMSGYNALHCRLCVTDVAVPRKDASLLRRF